jgi:hypothetical protein
MPNALYRLKYLAERCWAELAEVRPSLQQLYNELENLQVCTNETAVRYNPELGCSREPTCWAWSAGPRREVCVCELHRAPGQLVRGGGKKKKEKERTIYARLQACVKGALSQ